MEFGVEYSILNNIGFISKTFSIPFGTLNASSSAKPSDQVSSAALIGYVILDGKYTNLCNWVYVKRIGKLRCLKKKKYGRLRASVKNDLKGITGDKNYSYRRIQ